MADRCVTSYVKNGDEQTFSKYCGTKEYCEYSSKATCKAAENLGVSECKVTFCRGELCNAGFAAPKISGVVMLTCVLTLSHITDVFKFVTDFTVYHWVF